jgi:hypothetical protein
MRRLSCFRLRANTCGSLSEGKEHGDFEKLGEHVAAIGRCHRVTLRRMNYDMIVIRSAAHPAKPIIDGENDDRVHCKRGIPAQ